MIRRKIALRSKSADTLFHILSIFHKNQVSDRGNADIGPVTKDDVPLVCTDVLPNDSPCPKDASMDETRVDLDTQEDGLLDEQLKLAEPDETRVVLDKGDTDIGHITKDDVSLVCTDILPSDSPCTKDASMDETRVVLDTHEDDLPDEQPEVPEPDNNVVGETTVLCHNVDIDSSVSFDVNDQDNVMDLMTSSSHRLPTDHFVEQGEISGDLMDIGIESQVENDKNLISSFTVAVENVGEDMTGIVNKNTRNMVDYSEIAVPGNSGEPATQATAVIGSDSSLRHPGRVRLLESNLRNSKTRNQDLVNPLKRQRSFTLEERVYEKTKKLADLTTCPENINTVDASVNKDAADKKKRKRVVTQESKAKKKRNARLKRAEEKRKNGVNKPKLEVIVKEQIISICRHYMHGKCYEGEKCKFSHDTIPLTKSKPCCHFARHACMKGDDCPYDHQLSKYPCNKLLSTGNCDRSHCFFSHEAQPIEPTSDAWNKSMPDQESPNSGSKRVDTKSCSTPKSVASNTQRSPVDITPKVFTRPPKGISFLSQNKSPSESCSSPNVDSEVKETTKTPDVTHDSKEVTKTPPVVPLGINFLSFGKKSDSDNSNGGFSLKISNGIGKSPLGKLEGEGSKSDPAVNVVNDVKVDLPTDGPSVSQKPLPMMSFMSSTSQKALQSTLAFASKFEAGVKTNNPGHLTPKI